LGRGANEAQWCLITCVAEETLAFSEHDDELVANVINHAKVHGHEVGDTDRSQILSEAREI
jgi:hypothetical protein